MSTRKKVRANITWIPAAQGGRIPPTGPRFSTVARFAGVEEVPGEAWSLVLEWTPVPAGELAMKAEVYFLAEEGPQDRLVPGARFELYEGRKVMAKGEVLKD
jgi:hypothetical protein